MKESALDFQLVFLGTLTDANWAFRVDRAESIIRRCISAGELREIQVSREESLPLRLRCKTNCIVYHGSSEESCEMVKAYKDPAACYVKVSGASLSPEDKVIENTDRHLSFECADVGDASLRHWLIAWQSFDFESEYFRAACSSLKSVPDAYLDASDLALRIDHIDDVIQRSLRALPEGQGDTHGSLDEHISSAFVILRRLERWDVSEFDLLSDVNTNELLARVRSALELLSSNVKSGRLDPTAARPLREVCHPLMTWSLRIRGKFGLYERYCEVNHASQAFLVVIRFAVAIVRRYSDAGKQIDDEWLDNLVTITIEKAPRCVARLQGLISLPRVRELDSLGILTTGLAHVMAQAEITMALSKAAATRGEARDKAFANIVILADEIEETLLQIRDLILSDRAAFIRSNVH